MGFNHGNCNLILIPLPEIDTEMSFLQNEPIKVHKSPNFDNKEVQETYSQKHQGLILDENVNFETFLKKNHTSEFLFGIY